MSRVPGGARAASEHRRSGPLRFGAAHGGLPAAPPERSVRRYPRWCYEEKRYPDGRRNRFRSRVLLLRPGHGVLHFVSDRAYDLGGIYLPRRTVTFGLFWEDRPYNLYAWMTPDLSAPRALYFNICDQVALAAHRFDWRDLWVDVLAALHGPPQVLDRHEVPADTPQPMRTAIDTALHRVLTDLPAVAGYLHALLPTLRHRAATLAVRRSVA